MGMIRGNYTKKAISTKELKIASLKNELFICKHNIKKLRSTSTDSHHSREALELQRDLEVELLKKEVLMKRLVELGVVKGRGRPKKDDSEKYNSTHQKFTSMLLPVNLSYLKQLKIDNEITNISNFLDSLINTHRELNQK